VLPVHETYELSRALLEAVCGQRKDAGSAAGLLCCGVSTAACVCPGDVGVSAGLWVVQAII
jgi:hypothetical protein